MKTDWISNDMPPPPPDIREGLAGVAYYICQSEMKNTKIKQHKYCFEIHKIPFSTSLEPHLVLP